MNRKRKKVAILVSGSGTNMENIARRAQQGELNCEVVIVVCDNPEAFALKRANALGIKTQVIDRQGFRSKTEFDAAISKCLKEKKVEAIFLAGFMRILGPEFVRQWRWRVLNIHPSLLPKYSGTHAIRDALEAGERETGVTIHFVDEGVDSGPMILQRKVPIFSGDTLETLEARVHQVEYELYPEAVRLFLDGKVRLKGRCVEIKP